MKRSYISRRNFVYQTLGLVLTLTQVATYKIPANFLKLWAKMNPHTLSTKPWRVVA